MIFVIIKDIFWKMCIVVAVLIILLSLWKLAVASEHQKVFDLNNWEDRFAILLALSPTGIIGIQPIPEEFRLRAEIACIQQGIFEGSLGPLLPAGVGLVVQKNSEGKPIGVPDILCLDSIAYLNQDNNEGWKAICTLFRMNYVNKPSEESVLCEKVAPIQKYT